jgi:hypothetical protein
MALPLLQAIEMGSGIMMYIPGFKKIGSGVQNVLRGQVSKAVSITGCGIE